MMPSVRTLLSGVACFTIAASGWLGVMALVLHRPGYLALAGLALLFWLQSLVTLGLLAGRLTGQAARVVLALGASGIAAVGAHAVAVNLAGPHFEGYAVIIGAALVLQGVLTLGLFTSRGLRSSTELHRFGE